MSLIVTPWPQFHILDCVSQSPSVPLKHLQAWFSFLSLYAASCPHTFCCQPFLLFCSARADTLAGTAGGAPPLPTSITSATGGVDIMTKFPLGNRICRKFFCNSFVTHKHNLIWLQAYNRMQDYNYPCLSQFKGEWRWSWSRDPLQGGHSKTLQKLNS